MLFPPTVIRGGRRNEPTLHDGNWLTERNYKVAEYNREQAKTDAIVVLQNLIEQLRLHHGVPSKSDARAILREAMMEL